MVERVRLDDEVDVGLDDAEGIDHGYIVQSADNFMLFAGGLIIPSARGPCLFEDVMADFQRECFLIVEQSLYAVRDGTMPERRRFWIERTKKAAKDADLAVMILWLASYVRRPTLVQVCADTQEQAGIIKRRAQDILHYNPWLAERVSIQQNRIVSADGLCEVKVESTSTSEAKHGDTPDLLILNELVHVKRWEINQTHMNNADGVPQGVVIISTNAGIKGTPAEQWRHNAEKNPERWTMCVLKGRAPWINEADVADARRRDPVGIESKRLWDGKWVSGHGAAVPDEAIDRCFVHVGPIERPELGWLYFAGLDLGVSHDHAAVAVLGVNQNENRLRVAKIKAWEPQHGVLNDKGNREVDLDAVERYCADTFRTYRLQWFGYDPAAGGSFMAQRLRRKGLPMCELSFSSPKNLAAMARAFATSINDGKLECYDDVDGRLRRDFGKFHIEPRLPTGYRLTAISDNWGHADVGTAVVICLPRALSALSYGGFGEDDSLASEDESPFTEEDRAALPAELRDLYGDGAVDELWAARGRSRRMLVN